MDSEYGSVEVPATSFTERVAQLGRDLATLRAKIDEHLCRLEAIRNLVDEHGTDHRTEKSLTSV